MYNGKKYYLRKLQDKLMQENIFSIDIENFREKIFAEVILQRIAGKVDCDLIFLSNVEISLKCVDVIIINDINTKIIFKNKIYEMNTIDEVSSRLIRVFS